MTKLPAGHRSWNKGKQIREIASVDGQIADSLGIDGRTQILAQTIHLQLVGGYRYLFCRGAHVQCQVNAMRFRDIEMNVVDRLPFEALV